MKEFSHPGAKEKQKANINKSLENTVTVSKNQWKYSASLALELSEDIPEILCLPRELNQVFLNLIVNAACAIEEKAKAQNSADKGLITIATKADAEWVSIRISDTGGRYSGRHTGKNIRSVFHDKRYPERNRPGTQHRV